MISAGAASTSCNLLVGEDTKQKAQIDWEEQFKGNYKLMTDEEKEGTKRLMRSYELRIGKNISMTAENVDEDVLFGYAFNISKRQGYMDCVNACVEENNQDRDSQM